MQCTSYMRAGWTSALEHDLSTEEERRTLPFYQETARPEKREWMAISYFWVDGRDWCMGFYRGDDPFTPEDARHLAQPRTPSRQNCQSRPKVCGVRRRLEALGARASELGGHRPRCDRPRKANEPPAQNVLGDDFNLVRAVPRPTILPVIADCSSWFRLLCKGNAEALKPLRQSSSIGM